MKKIVLAAALLLTSVATFAQHEVGDFTIQPKVGLNIANTTKTESNYKVDFVGGAEAEYQVGEIFSVSTGLLYSRQGAKLRILIRNGTQAISTCLSWPMFMLCQVSLSSLVFSLVS